MLVEFFTDPVIRTPLLGTIFMCMATALVGVTAFVRRTSLIGEMLSHAAYPGVVMSVFVIAALAKRSELIFSLGAMGGGLLFSALSLYVMRKLEKKWKVASDNALCLVLSMFFGIGVLLASRAQFTHAPLFRSVQLFLYGQAATMTSSQVVLFSLLFVCIALFLSVFFRVVQTVCFDSGFARRLGEGTRAVEVGLFFLLLLAIVIGMSSVGLVLMSGMLIAPAIAARHLTSRLSRMFIASALFGGASALVGNFLSWKIPLWVVSLRGGESFSLPTGPMIVLVATFFALMSALFSPHRGVFSRWLRLFLFRRRCLEENLLKKLWKEGGSAQIVCCDLDNCSLLSRLLLPRVVARLTAQNEIEKKGKTLQLTESGRKRAEYIIRLHRLWEVYLVDYLGKCIEEVHASAEEMEHIITPELERELTEMLGDPSNDPHKQPIPARGNL